MNAFSKEEIVAFEDILEGFNDALILSKHHCFERFDDDAAFGSFDPWLQQVLCLADELAPIARCASGRPSG